MFTQSSKVHTISSYIPKSQYGKFHIPILFPVLCLDSYYYKTPKPSLSPSLQILFSFKTQASPPCRQSFLRDLLLSCESVPLTPTYQPPCLILDYIFIFTAFWMANSWTAGPVYQSQWEIHVDKILGHRFLTSKVIKWWLTLRLPDIFSSNF